MAKITTGTSFGLTARETAMCRMMVLGTPEPKVLHLTYGIDTSDTSATGRKALNKARRDMQITMEKPGFAECYRAMIKEMAWPVYGEAIDVIRKQLNNSNGWLANKAANDLLDRFAPVVMGTEDQAITIKIEGMPELGVPAQDD